MDQLIRKISFILLFILCAGCNEIVLLQEIEQKDANEIMVLLGDNGIKVQKEAIEKQQKITWTLKVSKKDEPLARVLLVKANLPREKVTGLEEICKNPGPIPTPFKEKCQLMLGLKGEIIDALEDVPGVISAKIVLHIPDKQEFANPDEALERATASVFVHTAYSEELSETLTESKIQELVSRGVPGLDMRDVSVFISRAAKTEISPVNEGDPNTSSQNPTAVTSSGSEVELGKVLGLQMDVASVKKFKILAIVVLVVFLVLSMTLIFTLLKISKNRQKIAGGGGTYLPALPEKMAMDQLVNEVDQAEQEKKGGNL